MKQIKYILLVSFLWTYQFSYAGTIPFDGNKIEIDGSFEQLAIHGSEISNEVTFTDLLDGASLLKSVTYKIEGSILKITITGHPHMRIDIPSHLNILCRPLPIIYEGSYIIGRDAHHIHVQDTDGEVEINCDGYKVTLSSTSGSASVVSYEDIHAILPNLSPKSILSLDTYLGDILLRIPHILDPKIKASAPKGSITIKGNTSLFKGQDAKGNEVMLHTEEGKQIFVTSLANLPNGPSHPELRDQLIKMYIEDQGKVRMDNESRKELTAMGFGPFIESLNDTYEGHQSANRHRKEFDEIVSKYGFPTEEMVGFQYALGAVRQVIFQSDRSYFQKYEDQFKRTFGEEYVKMYNRIRK